MPRSVYAELLLSSDSSYSQHVVQNIVCSSVLRDSSPYCVLHSLVILVIIVIIILLGVRGCLGLLSLLVVLLLLFGLLHLTQGLPLLHECVGLGHIVCDDDVIENCVALHLPEVKSDEAKVIVLVQVVIVHILRVGNLLCFPEALVGWVGDTLH